jgi:hypothetical protein
MIVEGWGGSHRWGGLSFAAGIPISSGPPRRRPARLGSSRALLAAGRVLVLERGRLVEQGTHEVMEPQGLYFYLASQQLEL